MKEYIERVKEQAHQAKEQIVKKYKATEEAIENSQPRFPVGSSISIVVILLGIFSIVGYWLEIVTIYFVVFAGLFALLAIRWLVRLSKDLPSSKTDTRTPVMEIPQVKKWRNVGLCLVIGSYLLSVIYLAERIPVPDGALQGVFFWGVFMVIALAGLGLLQRNITDGDKTARDMARVGVIFGALLVAWSIASISYSLVNIVTVSHIETESSLKKVVDNRKKAQGKYPGVTVAVALSGGGYRAATIHAGVLKALEGDAIPIHYLSTVSGGSIIGAYYALGHTPEEFISLLATKPGLANDLFHILNVGTELVGPQSMRDSDTYADHFRRVYFGTHTFQDLTNPTLIVNATTYKDRSRFVFSSDTTPQVALADAVAASGAFPGAFEPKRVAVQLTNGTVEDRDFIDGGVVENLGLEGLREYLKKRFPSPNTANTGNIGGACRAGLPNVLIVSDASKADKDPKGGSKELRLTLLKEASSTSYLALHRKLYRLFTNNQYDPDKSSTQPFFQGHQHLFDAQQDRHDCYLFTFVLDGTAEAEAKSMKGTQAAKVARFRTLKELDADEVTMGEQVGEVIARKYLPAIQCVIKQIFEMKSTIENREQYAENINNTCGALVRI